MAGATRSDSSTTVVACAAVPFPIELAGLPARHPMSLSIRPYHRFPVHCAISYHTGSFYGHGTIWNLSRTCWRPSGDLQMRPGECLSLTVTFPNAQRIPSPDSCPVVTRAGVCGGECCDCVTHPGTASAFRETIGHKAARQLLKEDGTYV